MRLMILEPYPDFGGGSEAVMLSLTQEFSRRGHEMFLLHEIDGTMMPAYRAATVRQFKRRLSGTNSRDLLQFVSLVVRTGRLCREQKIDAVVASHNGYLSVAACVRTLFGIPFCFHLGLPCVKETNRMRRFSFAQVAAGIAPSEHTASSWLKNGWPESTLHVVSNWVDPERFRPAEDRAELRRSLNLDVDRFYVTFVGRLCEEKGVSGLIAAFGAIAPRHPDARLILVGRTENSYAQQLAGHLDVLPPSVRYRVELRGATERPENYYAAADLLCLPPIWEEPFGLTIIEAMSSGTPIITTRVGQIPELLGSDNFDFIAEPGNPSDLAVRLDFWMRDRGALAARGKSLRKRAIQLFSANDSVDAYEQVLRSVTRSKVRIAE